LRKIIFNNEKHLKNIIENGFSTGKANYNDLIIIAYHYIWDLEYDKERTERYLTDFSSKWDSDFNYVIDRNLIRGAVDNAISKRISVLNDSIDITVPELDAIQKIKDFKKQKVLFVMLCLAKASYKNGKNYTVNRNYDRYIIQFSGTNITTNYYDNVLVGEFFNSGFSKSKKIRDSHTKKDDIYFEIYYCFPEGDVAFHIDNLGSDMINEYINYYGGEQIFCRICGTMTLKKSNRQILCPKCWEEKRRKDIKENVKNYRKRNVIVSKSNLS